jgi:hypothetical protein
MTECCKALWPAVNERIRCFFSGQNPEDQRSALWLLVLGATVTLQQFKRPIRRPKFIGIGPCGSKPQKFGRTSMRDQYGSGSSFHAPLFAAFANYQHVLAKFFGRIK